MPCQGFEIYCGHCKLYVCVCVCVMSVGQILSSSSLSTLYYCCSLHSHIPNDPKWREQPSCRPGIKKMSGKTVRKIRNCINDSCFCIWYDKIKVNGIIRQNKNGVYISIRYDLQAFTNCFHSFFFLKICNA